MKSGRILSDAAQHFTFNLRYQETVNKNWRHWVYGLWYRFHLTLIYCWSPIICHKHSNFLIVNKIFWCSSGMFRLSQICDASTWSTSVCTKISSVKLFEWSKVYLTLFRSLKELQVCSQNRTEFYELKQTLWPFKCSQRLNAFSDKACQ